MKPILVANWKMNLSLAESIALAQATAHIGEQFPGLDFILAPSLPWLTAVHEGLRWKPKNVFLASQVVSAYPKGAYTGDVAAFQLKNIVSYGLVGHSERRRYHHETGSIIADQVKQLLDHKITPIICFGEMSQSPQSSVSSQIVLDLSRDLAHLSGEEIGQCIFAYEPLWAIGTGHEASAVYIEKVITHTNAWFLQTYKMQPPILYGGSVDELNAEALASLRVLRGLLVGGASLEAARLKTICAHFVPRV